MTAFSACLILAIFAIMLVERGVMLGQTRQPLFRRISLLSVMPVVVFFITMFMITYRPMFSLALTVCALAVIVILNNAKYRALKEPLVFSDFALFRQVVHHPALYVKFIGVGKIVGMTVLLCALVAGALRYEPPLIDRPSLRDYFPPILYLFVVLGMIYAITRGPLRKPFVQLLRRFGPEVDVRLAGTNLPMVACLIVYFFLANEINQPSGDEPAPAPEPSRPEPPTVVRIPWVVSETLPPVVVAVQNESFFDLRRVSSDIPANLLPNWDRIARRSIYCGRLDVPAWGANTLRTEFSFLSGLPNQALGVHRFNPYLHLCKRPIWTIAHQFRAMGYRTVCVHPYTASFFERSRVFPTMGFDDFLDEAAFAGADRFGPYVSDAAVAEKILELVGARSQPLFIFAITMENHGRWERGRLDAFVPPEERQPLLGSAAFGLYARHAVNADRMLRRLVVGFQAGSDDAVLCMYGDHLPSLPKTFRRLGFAHDTTDYLIWRKSGGRPRNVDVSADALGRLVLDAAFDQANPRCAVRTRQEPSPGTAAK